MIWRRSTIQIPPKVPRKMRKSLSKSRQHTMFYLVTRRRKSMTLQGRVTSHSRQPTIVQVASSSTAIVRRPIVTSKDRATNKAISSGRRLRKTTDNTTTSMKTRGRHTLGLVSSRRTEQVRVRVKVKESSTGLRAIRQDTPRTLQTITMQR